jgi:hypothetical protein
MAFQYKVVPFMGHVRGSQTAAEISKQLAVVINNEAQQGWEFCQAGDVNIEVSPGCLAALFGQKASYARFDQLVFRRST